MPKKKSSGLLSNYGADLSIDEKEKKILKNRIESSKKAREAFAFLLEDSKNLPESNAYWERLVSIIEELVDVFRTKKKPPPSANWCCNFGLCEIPYGKYQGRKVSDIFETDPSYLDFLAHNKDDFKDNLKLFIKAMTSNSSWSLQYEKQDQKEDQNARYESDSEARDKLSRYVNGEDD